MKCHCKKLSRAFCEVDSIDQLASVPRFFEVDSIDQLASVPSFLRLILSISFLMKGNGTGILCRLVQQHKLRALLWFLLMKPYAKEYWRIAVSATTRFEFLWLCGARRNNRTCTVCTLWKDFKLYPSSSFNMCPETYPHDVRCAWKQRVITSRLFYKISWVKADGHLSVTFQFRISTVRSVRRICSNGSVWNTCDGVCVPDTDRKAVI
jgi:hypothetical protein